MKVLLIEDDALLGESLREYLQKEGFSVTWMDDERGLMQFLGVSMYDIVVLDLMLKFSRGEDLVHKIKAKGLPVIIVTAKADLAAKEECFSLGADDYMVKPFDPRELALRINAVCRRYYNTAREEKIGDVVVDMENRVVIRDGKEMVLTQKEWDLLEFLVKRRGKVVSHDDILNYVWGDADVGEESVRTYVKRLRSILPAGAIETCKGRGYRLK